MQRDSPNLEEGESPTKVSMGNMLITLYLFTLPNSVISRDADPIGKTKTKLMCFFFQTIDVFFETETETADMLYRHADDIKNILHAILNF